MPNNKFGVSFSSKQCHYFGLDEAATLQWLLQKGIRRFRLMSYWNEIEKEPGKYNFEALDRQLQLVEDAGGEVSLCLGVKQPRWPEYHWPQWALESNDQERSIALLAFVRTVAERYKVQPTVTSWQLENEALLSNFGSNIQVDRKRLRQEYELVKDLDPERPIIMSTSNGWGIPLRRPLPDLVGFSYYTVMFNKGAYQETIQKPWLHKTRAGLIKILRNRDTFIHELQLEPWGPNAIWEMDNKTQDESMPTHRIAQNITLAKSLKLYPIDLWGAEWWYWRHLQGDNGVWKTVKTALGDELHASPAKPSRRVG